MATDRFSQALAFHRSVAVAFAAAAEEVAPEAWHRPRAEGKWSPAQITDHLIQTYDVVVRELDGGEGMRIRTPFLARMLLRMTVMPRLLRGGRFPERAPAPPELRPSKTPAGQPDAVALFRQRAAEFEAAAERARTNNPRAGITHAYFGRASLPKSVVFCARHIDHHRAQIAVRG
jgi:uncharacterized damage-inducible protein DinB